MADTRNRIESLHLAFIIFILSLNSIVNSADLKFTKDQYFRIIDRNSFKSHKHNTFDKLNINEPLFTEFSAGGRESTSYQNIETGSKLSKLKSNFKDGEIIPYSPGQKSPPFSLWTLNGQVHFPSETLKNKSLFIHVFNPDSGFLECLWTSDEALSPIVSESKENVSFIFIPKTAGINDLYGSVWMQNRLKSVIQKVFM